MLERAADDVRSIARLTEEGSKALQDYNLTWPDKAALLSSDIKWIETRLGKLDDRQVPGYGVDFRGILVA